VGLPVNVPIIARQRLGINTFPQQTVGDVVFCAVRVVSKERMRLGGGAFLASHNPMPVSVDRPINMYLQYR
jgi:hypothetical protein